MKLEKLHMAKMLLNYFLTLIIVVGCKKSNVNGVVPDINTTILTIDKIWSDQFEGVKANYLPGGAGEKSRTQKSLDPLFPHETGFIMMGVRSNGKAYMKATIKISTGEPSIKEKVLVRLAIIDFGNSLTIVRTIPSSNQSIIWTGDIAEVSLSTDINCTNLGVDCSEAIPIFIVAGIDANGTKDLERDEIKASSSGFFRVVSKELYDNSISFLKSSSWVSGPLPLASNFVHAFLHDVPPLEAENRGTIDVSTVHDLSHNVGVKFTKDRTGPIKDFYFPSTSGVASAIRLSTTFKNLIQSTLESKKNEVTSSGNYTFDLPPKTLTFSELEPDLFLSFHDVELEASKLIVNVECINNTLQVNLVRIEGKVNDLFDFSYYGPWPSRHALYVQTGYGTTGIGGNIYRIQASFDGFVYFPFQFGSCNSDGPPVTDCGNFPPPLGEIWTYRVLGNSYVFSIITEPVSALIGGHKVFRWRRSDSPQGLGDYIGCDPNYGKVWVATDSWDVNNPSDYEREVFPKPIPWDLCPHGTSIATTRDDRQFVGVDFRTEVQVISYEDVTVPYGTFKNVQKVKITHYEDGKIDDENTFFQWRDKNIGVIKELDVDPNSSEIGIVLTAYKKP